MPRANGRVAARHIAGLLDETSLKSFRSELASFLGLPAPFRQRLERLAAEPNPNPEDISRAYRALPFGAVHILTYILSLDANDFFNLRKQLGAHARDVDDIKAKFDALAPRFKNLDDLSDGITNSWESFDHNILYNFSREYPSLEYWLFDSVGKQIFYSRSDVDDFGWLADALLEGVSESIKRAKDHGLPLTKLCTKNVLDAATSIEQHCQKIRETLSRK
ncbi:MAG: hypothetical protein ACLQVG_06565 [Terriglobia bacterium]